MRYLPKDIENYTRDNDALVNFISVVTPKTDFEQLICDAYNTSYVWNQELSKLNKEKLNENFFYCNNSETLSNWDKLNNYNISFSEISMLDDFDSTETFLDRFVDYMVKNTVFTRVFSDETYRLNMEFLYKEIYFLEMQLREVLSHIYIKEFYPGLDDFHKNLKELPKWKKEWENFNNIVKESWKIWENVFFRFTFNDYKHILDRKYPSTKELIDLIQTNDSLEWIQATLSSNTIQNQNYINFLNWIIESLESIEKVRNAIMHFRRPSQTELENYEVAKNKLLEKIESFQY